MTKEEAWFCLCSIPDMDSFRMQRFVSLFDDVRDLFSEDLSDLDTGELFSHAFFATMLEAIRNRDRVPEQMKKMLDKGIRFVSI